MSAPSGAGQVTLRAGLGIVNPDCGLQGTIGLIARDPLDQSLWIVSCCHVLIRPPDWSGQPAAASEAVEVSGAPGIPCAWTDAVRANASLDCAAARVAGGVNVDASIAHLGLALAPPANPEPYMQVVKLGAATGLTRGKVECVDATGVLIVIRPGCAGQLTEPGDSGAVWFDEATGAPVALHRRGNVSGVEFSRSTPISAALQSLRLVPA